MLDQVLAVERDGTSVGYTYDALGRQTSVTYPGGQSVQRTFDAAGQLTSLQDWLGGEYEFDWDVDGLLDSVLYPNGVKSEYSKDAAGQVSSVDVVNDQHQQILDLAFTYSPAGLMTSQGVTRSRLPRVGAAEGDDWVFANTYGFDELSRVSTVGGSAGGDVSFTAAGYVDQLDTGAQLTYGAGGQLASLTGAGGEVTSYGYDQRGNRLAATSDGASRHHVYNGADQLVGLQLEDGREFAYAYTFDGLRATASTGGVVEEFWWDTLAGVPLLLSDADHLYVYGLSSVPLAQVDKAPGANGFGVEYLHTDLIGSVRAVTDSEGVVAGDSDYTVYGQPLQVGDTAQPGVGEVTRFGFAGEYTDDSGYLYLRARYYDPTSGQFLTRDPLEDQTREAYSYTGGNPLQFVDPLGLSWEDWLVDDDGESIALKGLQSYGAASFNSTIDFLGLGYVPSLKGTLLGIESGSQIIPYINDPNICDSKYDASRWSGTHLGLNLQAPPHC